MSHPGHIRHFDPQLYKSEKENIKVADGDLIDNIKDIAEKQVGSFSILWSKLSKSHLFKYREKIKFRRKKPRLRSVKPIRVSEAELKEKYLAEIRRQKETGFVGIITIPMTWLSWKMENKSRFLNVLVGLLISTISLTGFTLLDGWLSDVGRTFLGIISAIVCALLMPIISLGFILGIAMIFYNKK